MGVRIRLYEESDVEEMTAAARESSFEAEALGRLRLRAEQAAACGQSTFAIPEAAAVAERLAALTPSGALRAEAEGWLMAGAHYHALVRLAARVLTTLGDDSGVEEAVYVPKAGGELEPMLALWPAVLAVPTTQAFTSLELVALRPFPVHPLGGDRGYLGRWAPLLTGGVLLP